MGRLASTEIAGVNDQMKYEHQKKKKRKENSHGHSRGHTVWLTGHLWEQQSKKKKKTTKRQRAHIHTQKDSFHQQIFNI